jgi:hypothetical protein
MNLVSTHCKALTLIYSCLSLNSIHKDERIRRQVVIFIFILVTSHHDKHILDFYALKIDSTWIYLCPKQELLGRIKRLLSFDTSRTAQKKTPPTNHLFSGNTFTVPLPGIVKGYTYRPSDSPLILHEPHRSQSVQQFFCCCIYSLLCNVLVNMFQSRCLATILGNKHTDTQTGWRSYTSTFIF